MGEVMNQTEKKKKAILETTFALLNEKEIKDITIEEIAEKAEVSKVTLFKYYLNKNHLMKLVIFRAFEHMAEEIEQILDGNMDFEATYHAITQMKLAQIEQYSPIFTENLMSEYTNDPEFFDSDTINLQSEIYKKLFEKGKKEGKISSGFSEEDFLFIIHIFAEGMKGFTADTLFAKTDVLTKFFVNGLR